MKRSIGIILMLVGIAFPVGCGGQADPNSDSSANIANKSVPVSTNPNTVPPNEIVAMFSDSIRRGDKETTIKLITLAAREEIQRRGMTIDPPGSPDASYKIGEVKFFNDDRDAAFVESMWIEPGTVGQPPQETEVVWAVQLEPEGWRISGLAIDNGPDVQPTLVDFENLEVDVAETAPAQPNQSVVGNEVSAPTSAPVTAGLQTPPIVPSTNSTTAPSANGFTLPELGAPQISQPPNIQFR